MVALNKADAVDDEELLELVELEVRELLTEYEFPGDDLPVVRVSALKALEGDAEWQAKIVELMEAVDAYIPEPERDLDKPFLMPIEDVFTITGRGTVVTGKVEQGIVHTGDEVEIVGLRPTQKTVCTGWRCSARCLDEGQAGDNIGALLRGTKKEEVERGQVLCKPGSITPHTDFEAQVYVLTQGGGWPAQAVLQQLSAAVLLPDDGCDGLDHVAGGHRDGACRVTTRSMTVELASRSPWTKACGSPSARVAAPSAPAASSRSSSRDETPMATSRRSASA